MKYDSGITRTGSEWEFTHLCRVYGKDPCEYFLQTDNEKTVLNGKTLAPCSYYCTSENKVRKIGSGGTWTGLSPKFCPKRKEIFNKSEAAEQSSPQISYIDKLREKYPKVNETDEWFDTVYCPSDLFDGDGVNDPADDKCSYITNDDEACQKCWRERCPANISFVDDLEDFEEEYFENYPDEEPTDPVPESETVETPAETSVTVQNENTEVQAAFDYSELDGDTADKLRAVSERVVSIKAKYIIETAKQVKVAHDLLANHKNGLFGLWCESVGFSRHTGTNLVHVAETFPDLDIVEQFDNISAKLLYEASRPSAPPELVEQVRNGDITTHKDYIALKKQLEEARSETETAKRDSEKISAKLAAEAAKADELKRNIEELNEKNTRLALEVVKLEKRPVDVIVDSSEVNKRVAEAVSKINSETEQTLAAREQEFAETLHFKDERIWALEDKLKELGGSPETDKKIYLLSMTDEDYRKMLAELNGSSFRNILEAAAIVDIK